VGNCGDGSKYIQIFIYLLFYTMNLMNANMNMMYAMECVTAADADVILLPSSTNIN
jgi:hypothetical protein